MTIRWISRHDLRQYFLDGRWKGFVREGLGDTRLRETFGDDRLHRGPGEDLIARQQLVEHATQAVEVAPSIDVDLTGDLLRTHVGRSAQQGTVLRERVAARRSERFADAEVGHHGHAVVDHDVLRFDVSMDDALPVRVIERASHRTRDLQRILHRDSALAGHSHAQRRSLDVRHDEVEVPIVLAGVVERQDMRVTQSRGKLDLTQKALLTDARRQLGTQDLDRHRTVVLEIPAQKHAGHAPTADLTLDRVAVGKRGGVFRVPGHGRERCAAGPRCGSGAPVPSPSHIGDVQPSDPSLEPAA